jgi:hypothetical protein
MIRIGEILNLTKSQTFLEFPFMWFSNLNLLSTDFFFFFRRVCIIAKSDDWLRHVCPSVCLSVRHVCPSVMSVRLSVRHVCPSVCPSCLSVCLSARNNSAPTERIFRKLYFSKICPENSRFISITCCFTLDAGPLAISQYPEGPATGHLDITISRFPCVYKRMLRRFPSFPVATTRFSCSPPHLNFLVTYIIFYV